MNKSVCAALLLTRCDWLLSIESIDSLETFHIFALGE